MPRNRILSVSMGLCVEHERKGSADRVLTDDAALAVARSAVPRSVRGSESARNPANEKGPPGSAGPGKFGAEHQIRTGDLKHDAGSRMPFGFALAIRKGGIHMASPTLPGTSQSFNFYRVHPAAAGSQTSQAVTAATRISGSNWGPRPPCSPWLPLPGNSESAPPPSTRCANAHELAHVRFLNAIRVAPGDLAAFIEAKAYLMGSPLVTAAAHQKSGLTLLGANAPFACLEKVFPTSRTQVAQNSTRSTRSCARS